MPGALICILFAGFIAVAIGLMVLAHKAAQERLRAMQAFAAELGFSFDPASYGGWDRQWPRFECFAQGHSRRAFNLLTGPFPAARAARRACSASTSSRRRTAAARTGAPSRTNSASSS